MKSIAIVLAGGSGKRMGTNERKQYIFLEGRPVLYYSLEAFQNSEVDKVILVVPKGDEIYCKKEIIEKYKLSKVCGVVSGGKERYNSVYEGLKYIESDKDLDIQDEDVILIHDGARPFLSSDIISRSLKAVLEYGACITGVKVKDTIKLSDESGFVESTVPRERAYNIQTPQSFFYNIIKTSYDKILEQELDNITDDGMVVENSGICSVKIIEGSYINIKITTPEDIDIGKNILKNLVKSRV